MRVHRDHHIVAHGFLLALRVFWRGGAMQLPAEQTSLEPHPRRASKGGPQAVREPEHPQEATAADSRASPPCSMPADHRSTGFQKDLNKFPNRSRTSEGA